jgi:hypothetical protein
MPAAADSQQRACGLSAAAQFISSIVSLLFDARAIGPGPGAANTQSQGACQRVILVEATDLFGLFGAFRGVGGDLRQNRRIATQPAHRLSGANAII